MSYQELVDYILKARGQGFDDAKIKEKLLSAGWLLGAVTEGFLEADSKEHTVKTQTIPKTRQSAIKQNNSTTSVSKPGVGQVAQSPSSVNPSGSSVNAKTSDTVSSQVPGGEKKDFSSAVASEAPVSSFGNNKRVEEGNSATGGTGDFSKTASNTSSKPVDSKSVFPAIVNAPSPTPREINIQTTEKSVTSMPVASRPKSHRLVMSLVIVVILLLLGVGGTGLAGYFGYIKIPFIEPSPDVVWKRYSESNNETTLPSDVSFQTALTMSYEDMEEQFEDNIKNYLPDELKNGNLSLSVNAEGLLQAFKDRPEAVEADVQLSLRLSSGGQSFSFSLPIILKEDALYADVSGLPFLKSRIKAGETSEDLSWIKIPLDPANLEDLALEAEDFAETDVEVTDIFQTIDIKMLEEFERTHPVLVMNGLVGKEELRGEKTYKYQLNFNKENFKALTEVYLDEIFKAANSGPVLEGEMNDTKNMLKRQIASVFEQTALEPVYLWVGPYDYQLHKMEIKGTVISLISAVNTVYKGVSSMLVSDEAGQKKLSDVSQVGFALDLFKNEKGGFPAGLEGQAVGLTPEYLDIWPVAPASTGVCSEWNNTYWYTPKGEARDNGQGQQLYSDYEFTFCLEKPVGGFPAGLGTMTPESGILVNGREACFGEGCGEVYEDLNSSLENITNNIKYNAKFSLSLEMYDFKTNTVPIEPPANAYDITQVADSERSEQVDTILTSEDAVAGLVLSTVRQRLSALELYFNDFGEYPDTLSALTPTYIGDERSLDFGAIGVCTEETGRITYTKLESMSYELLFCLPVSSGGYSAGVHRASEKGIE